MKICPYCGSQELDDNKFCRSCGASFVDENLARKAALQGQVLEETVVRVSEDAVKPEENPKKSPGKKIKVIAILVVVLAVLGTAAYFVLSYYFSPEQRLQRALDSGNMDAAVEIVKEDISLRRSEELLEDLKSRVEALEAEYISGTVEYDDALQNLAGIEEFGIKDLAEVIGASRERIERLNDSRAVFADGEALLEAGDYLDAIASFAQVIEEDSNYAVAQEKITQAEDGYRGTMLDKAATYANSGDYDGAITVLNSALINLPNDKMINEQIATYQNAKADKLLVDTLVQAAQLAEGKDYLAAITVLDQYVQKNGENVDITIARNDYQDAYKAQVLADAAAYAAETDYLSALDTIEKAVEFIGEDAELIAKAEVYENAYAEDISSQIDVLLAENKIEAAKTLLQGAAKEVPGNEIIRTRQEELNAYKTVSLSSLSPVNDGFTWNDGVPEDPFGNSYLNLQNYVIFHSGYSSWDGHGGNTETHSAEYQVNKQYDTLSFGIVPYSEFGQDGWSYIRIYVDNVLRYTSDKVTQKTQPYSVSVDISDATYIKIIAYTDKFSCTMLTDVMLSKLPNFSSTRVQGYTSLSILDVFNGSLDWENDYPYDTLKTSYNNMNNYAVLHAGYSTWEGHGGNATQYSVEYYINKQYTAISLNIAPCGDFGAQGSANIKIYADDVLIYTSPTIVQKTERFNTGEIDISQASYLKIVAEIDEFSCTIISDVLLKNAG